MVFASSSPTKVPASTALAIRFSEAMTLGSSRSIRPMALMFGLTNASSGFSLIAMYWVPVVFSM